MIDKNLKPLSTRLDPSTIEKLDQVASSLRYWKRNTIINGILTAVINTASERDIQAMVGYHPKLNKCITKITVERP